MVVFTCNHCGSSLKKKDVEKHYGTRCSHKPIFVSCMDCSKDFKKDYENHYTCITEAEKYGKNFTPKESTVSKLKKKAAWTEFLKKVAEDNINDVALKERTLLQYVADQSNNVPMKKQSFCNFINNGALRNIPDHVKDNVWQLIETTGIKNGLLGNNLNSSKLNESSCEKNDGVENNGIGVEDLKVSNDSKEKKKGKKKNKESVETVHCNVQQSNSKTVETESLDESNLVNGKNENEMVVLNNLNGSESLSKKERKAKRKREKYEKELQEVENQPNENGTLDNGTSFPENEEPVKKKKKHTSDTGNEISENNMELESKKEKKKKNKKTKDGNTDLVPNDENIPEIKTEVGEDNTGTIERTKFNWQEIIVKTLESKGELPIKKLEKKVVNEYINSGKHVVSREKIIAKFHKKVTSIPGVKIKKEVVKLVSNM